MQLVLGTGLLGGGGGLWAPHTGQKGPLQGPSQSHGMFSDISLGGVGGTSGLVAGDKLGVMLSAVSVII